MIIFIVKRYLWDGERYVQTFRRNYDKQYKAKNHILDYKKDLSHDVELKVLTEEEYTQGELLYNIEFSWTGYFNTARKEKLTISREYVY